jgi:hypothetical protein
VGRERAAGGWEGEGEGEGEPGREENGRTGEGRTRELEGSKKAKPNLDKIIHIV